MGKLYRFHNDVDTDQIIASQYLLFPTIDEIPAAPLQQRRPAQPLLQQAQHPKQEAPLQMKLLQQAQHLLTATSPMSRTRAR